MLCMEEVLIHLLMDTSQPLVWVLKLLEHLFLFTLPLLLLILRGMLYVPVDPQDIVMLVLLWHMKAATMCEFSKQNSLVDYNLSVIMLIAAAHACLIHFEEQSPSKVAIVFEYDDRMLKDLVGFKLWYRKSTANEYPDEANFIALSSVKRYKLDSLDPSTQYFFKVSFFRKAATLLAVQEVKWVTPSVRTRFKSGPDEVQREKENATTDSTMMLARVHEFY